MNKAGFSVRFLLVNAFIATVWCGTLRLSAQTVEVVGSAGVLINARVPVINDAGNIFYVNGSTEVLGTPTNYFGLQGRCAGRDGKPSGGNRVGQLAFVNGVTTYRVSYTQSTPVILNNPLLVAGQLQLTFPTEAGKSYHLQVNTNLAVSNWSDVQVYAGDGSTKTNLSAPLSRGFDRLFVP